MPKSTPRPLTQDQIVQILRCYARRIAGRDSHLADECLSAALIAALIEGRSVRIAKLRMFNVCRRETLYQRQHVLASDSRSTALTYPTAKDDRTPWDALAEAELARFIESIEPPRLRVAIEKTAKLRPGAMTPAERQALHTHRYRIYYTWLRFSGGEQLRLTKWKHDVFLNVRCRGWCIRDAIHGDIGMTQVHTLKGGVR